MSKNQISGLVVYSAILPLALLMSETYGSWILTLGAIISLPLAPLGFLVFWLVASKSVWLAFFITWIFNIFQGWLFLKPYLSKMQETGKKPRLFLRFAIPTLIGISVLFVAVFILGTIT